MFTSRRAFLKEALGASALLSLAPAAPSFLLRAATAAGKADLNGRVLVVLQMAGGNDGLNTVIPFEDDQYAQARTTLRLKSAQVHRIAPGLGFHPELKDFYRLLKDSDLTIVQGAGYTKMHRDHGAAMRIWQAGDPEQSRPQAGWLGRAVDYLTDKDPSSVPATFIGSIGQPFTLHSRRSVVPAVRSLQDLVARTPQTSPAAAEDANPLLQYAARTAQAASADSAKVAAILKATSAASTYPQFGLARSLQAVAQLIRADLGVRIFYVELGGGSPGGFDNHANQAGNHAALLRELSQSTAAFVDDLKSDRLLDRVLLMTFSEFGRTLHENGRHGTNHGAAAPMFLAGGRCKGGLIGAHPSLKDLEEDAPKAHTDFRRVYTTALQNWLGLPAEEILGQRFAPLEVLS